MQRLEVRNVLLGDGRQLQHHPLHSGLGPGHYNNEADWTLKVSAPAAPADTTPPVITPTITGTLGNNGWYTSNVELSWSVVDNQSTVTSTSGCDTVNITSDQSETAYTCEAESAGGRASETVRIKRDATAPTLNPSVSPNPVLLNGTATADPDARDNLSGIASASCGSVDTSSVGSKSVSCSATDNAGNAANGNANYRVGYGFVGFDRPVDNGTVLNRAKAGSAIPLKWQLVDANGEPVTNLAGATVTVASLTCSVGVTADNVEEYAAGGSGLQNLGGGYYQLNWKTPTNYANSCKTMRLDLGEGSTRTALFQFTK